MGAAPQPEIASRQTMMWGAVEVSSGAAETYGIQPFNPNTPDVPFRPNPLPKPIDIRFSLAEERGVDINDEPFLITAPKDRDQRWRFDITLEQEIPSFPKVEKDLYRMAHFDAACMALTLHMDLAIPELLSAQARHRVLMSDLSRTALMSLGAPAGMLLGDIATNRFSPGDGWVALGISALGVAYSKFVLGRRELEWLTNEQRRILYIAPLLTRAIVTEVHESHRPSASERSQPESDKAHDDEQDSDWTKRPRPHGDDDPPILV